MNRTHLSSSKLICVYQMGLALLLLVFPDSGFSFDLEKYLQAFQAKQTEIRRSALEAEELRACFSSEDDSEKCDMGKEQFHRLVTALLDLLDDPEPKIRVTAIYYLNQSTETRTKKPIARLLRDPSAEVRAAAAEAFSLSSNVDVGIVQELERLLMDKDKRVRVNAAVSLERSGTRQSLALIRGALRREVDSEVREIFSEVVDVLEKRFGKDNSKRKAQ